MKQLTLYPGYKITRDGKVYSIKHKKYLKEKASFKAYPRVILYKDGVAKSCWIHRLVAEAFCGLQGDDEVHHKDKNPLNYHADNLKPLSRKEHRKAHRLKLKDMPPWKSKREKGDLF